VKKYLLFTVLIVLGLVWSNVLVASQKIPSWLPDMASTDSKVSRISTFYDLKVAASTKVTVETVVKSNPAMRVSTADKLNLAESQELYDRRCAYCHGEDGFTERPNTPSLGDHEFQRSRTDQQLFTAISEGIAPRMPSYADSLSEAEIRGLVAFIRSLDKKNPGKQNAQNPLAKTRSRKSARTRNFR
jgi:mono/diheme cytochrome c family protein